MRWKGLLIGLSMALWPLCSEALTRDDFLVRTTQDLIKLCTAGESEPLHQAALGFCHGYTVGAYHYYQAITPDAGRAGSFCLPDPQPTRVEAIQMFITWTKDNPQHMNDRPVDSMFRFLGTKFPCRR
jgi:hypothetical protein